MKFFDFFSKYKAQTPLWIAVIPLVVLVVVLALVIKCFGADAIMGGSQVALLFAAAVATVLAIFICGYKWQVLEEAIVDNIRTSASAIIILLLIGAISGTWMLSGTVPAIRIFPRSPALPSETVRRSFSRTTVPNFC